MNNSQNGCVFLSSDSLLQKRSKKAFSEENKANRQILSYKYMEEMISNIKISPIKDQKYKNAINQLFKALNSFKDLIDYNKIVEEVQTISILIHSIVNKLQNTKQTTIKESNKKSIISDSKVSFEDKHNSSGIIYTNFSLVQLEQQSVRQKEHDNRRKSQSGTPLSQKMNKQWSMNENSLQIITSKHGLNNKTDKTRIQPLNKQINILDRLLKQKMKTRPGKIQQKNRSEGIKNSLISKIDLRRQLN